MPKNMFSSYSILCSTVKIVRTLHRWMNGNTTYYMLYKTTSTSICRTMLNNNKNFYTCGASLYTANIGVVCCWMLLLNRKLVVYTRRTHVFKCKCKWPHEIKKNKRQNREREKKRTKKISKQDWICITVCASVPAHICTLYSMRPEMVFFR